MQTMKLLKRKLRSFVWPTLRPGKKAEASAGKAPLVYFALAASAAKRPLHTDSLLGTDGLSDAFSWFLI